jgi:hypothetical protein
VGTPHPGARPAGRAPCAGGDHFVMRNPLRAKAPVGRYKRIPIADHREAQGEASIKITKRSPPAQGALTDNSHAIPSPLRPNQMMIHHRWLIAL